MLYRHLHNRFHRVDSSLEEKTYRNPLLAERPRVDAKKKPQNPHVARRLLVQVLRRMVPSITTKERRVLGENPAFQFWLPLEGQNLRRKGLHAWLATRSNNNWPR
jgi:hypothetical protein